jgi:hypothetical protein
MYVMNEDIEPQLFHLKITRLPFPLVYIFFQSLFILSSISLKVVSARK